jgi:DAACS family dicarboxylate/amino acid:cation (Na+ or H+) symporter/aerobic C4-dicarboxylate transport protein
MAIAKWVGALDTEKMHKALNGEVEEPAVHVSQTEKPAGQTAPLIPSLKRAAQN